MKVELPAFFVTQEKKADRRNIPWSRTSIWTSTTQAATQ